MKVLKKVLLCCAMLFCGMYLIGSVFLVVIAPFLDIEGPWVMMITGAIMALLFGWLFAKAWVAFRSAIGLQSKSSKQSTNKRYGIRDETKYKIKLGASLLTALVGAGMIVSSREDLFEAGIPLVFGGILFAFGFSCRRKKKVNQEKEARALAQAQANLEANLKRVDSMSVLPVMVPDTVVLRPGEVCHYQAAANVMQIKNEVIGHTSGSAGVSVRVAKGLTLRSGSSRGHAIRQDVSHLYPGLFTITNQRFIMTGEKGFDHPVSKLTAITPFNGFEGITLQFGRSSYTILMDEPYIVPKIWDLMNTPAPTQKEEHAPEKLASVPPPSLEPEKMANISSEKVGPDAQVPTPEGAELSYLDAEALRFWDGKKTDFVVPQYYSKTPFGRNVEPALQRLLDSGYLAYGDIRQRVSLHTIPELKAVLADRELKVSGNKKELVSRIIDNFDSEDLEELFPVNDYHITEKGKSALAPYSIIKVNDERHLGIPYSRLLKAKEEHPDEEDAVILTKILSDDIQTSYQTGNQTEFLRVIEKTAQFMEETGKYELAFKCYSLAYFVWVTGMHKDIFGNTMKAPYYIPKNLDRCGILCEYDRAQLVEHFKDAICKSNPFGLATAQHLDAAVAQLKSALKIN